MMPDDPTPTLDELTEAEAETRPSTAARPPRQSNIRLDLRPAVPAPPHALGRAICP